MNPVPQITRLNGGGTLCVEQQIPAGICLERIHEGVGDAAPDM